MQTYKEKAHLSRSFKVPAVHVAVSPSTWSLGYEMVREVLLAVSSQTYPVSVTSGIVRVGGRDFKYQAGRLGDQAETERVLVSVFLLDELD